MKLPITFFTIVYNGMPFIKWHYDQMRELETPWHWVIVEGVASQVKCTEWCLNNGGRLPEGIIENGYKSTDGTHEYLKQLAAADPGRVTHIFLPKLWIGKVQMCAAALVHAFWPESLLWQIDVDEIWQTWQFRRAQTLFEKYPLLNAAYYRCLYFVGPNRIITTHGTYGNNSYEWLRTWRLRGGEYWQSHEPPKLLQCGFNVASTMPSVPETVMPHAMTEREGLVFQHFAYTTPEQLRFKERYYGYKNALQHWYQLQNFEALPAKLKDFFPWVKDEAIVASVSSQNIRPLIQL